MKLSTSVLAASLLGSGSLANPIITKIAPIVGGTNTISTSELLERDTDWCTIVGKALDAYEKVPDKYKGWVLSSAFAGTGAYGVCRILKHQPENNAMCVGYGAAVSGIMGSVAVGVVNYHEMSPSGASGTKRNIYLVSKLEDDLRERGLDFESIGLVPTTSRRDSNVGSTSVQILGMRSEDGLVTDHKLSFRSDGTGTATITVPSPAVDGAIIKRHTGPGFKMSYKFLVNTASQLDNGAAKKLGVNFGRDWEQRASSSKTLSSYYGKAQFTTDHVMGFRISPMANSYDDSYEDINGCGVIKA